jgi:branched-chain amino acid transport system ATP-binding protein
MANATPILETRDLTIRFGGHVAVNAVSCAFARGTLTAIVGPNGAGKTTYFNLISGQLAASAGDVLLQGRTITGLGAPARARLGLGRAFQLTNLFPNLSVIENVRLAVQARAGIGLDFLTMASRHRALAERAAAHLARVKLQERANAAAAALSHGDQRKLEVAILLALEPEIFMFDEPTAGMSVDEVPVILDLIEAIKAQGDKTSSWWSTRWMWCAGSPTGLSCCTTARWWPTAPRPRWWPRRSCRRRISGYARTILRELWT